MTRKTYACKREPTQNTIVYVYFSSDGQVASLKVGSTVTLHASSSHSGT
jgi:hypothetical protein